MTFIGYVYFACAVIVKFHVLGLGVRVRVRVRVRVWGLKRTCPQILSKGYTFSVTWFVG